MSHIRLSHVQYIRDSYFKHVSVWSHMRSSYRTRTTCRMHMWMTCICEWHAYVNDMHMRMIPVPYMHESCSIYEWVWSHAKILCVPMLHAYNMSHMYMTTSCFIHERVVSHISMSHCVLSHISIRRVACYNVSHICVYARITQIQTRTRARTRARTHTHTHTHSHTYTLTHTQTTPCRTLQQAIDCCNKPHIYERVKSHTWISDDAHMNACYGVVSVGKIN